MTVSCFEPVRAEAQEDEAGNIIMINAGGWETGEFGQ